VVTNTVTLFESYHPLGGEFSFRHYLNIIDQWLKDDKQRPEKQRHTAARVFNRLKQEYEFKGAETTKKGLWFFSWFSCISW